MDELTMLGTANGGVFTTRQAEALGIARDALCAAVRNGHLRRLARGLYATGDAPESTEAEHLELCRALLLEYPDAVLAGHSAVVALDLPTWRVPLGTALVQRPVVRQVRRSGALIRGSDDPGTSVMTPTGPVTPLVRALVQVALDHGSVPGVVSADAALHRGLVTAEDLGAEVTRRGGHRRIQQAMAMQRLMDGTSESPGESRLRVTLGMGGIEVEPQFVVRDDRGEVVGRADLRVVGTRVLIEFDGRVKYADGGVDALVREKKREDRLRALGWIVVRFTWGDLEHPDRVLAAVRRAVAVAAAAGAQTG